MIKKILLSCATITLITSTSIAQWISLNKYSLPDSPPNVQLISDDDFGAVIKVDLPGFRINEFTANGKTYHSIDIGAEGITREIGYPELSYIAKVLAIPDQGSISVEVIETSPVQIFKGINIPPARESWMEGKPESPFVENLQAYNSEDVYPFSFAKVEDPVILRDFRIARVSIFPVRYSPSKKEIQAVSSITIKINYTPGFGVNPKTTPQRPLAPSFAQLYKGFIFNYDDVLKRRYGGRELGYDYMLCIMPDALVDSFQVYANWKHKTGTFIHVTKFSDIGASASDPNPIKNHILDAYTNWEIPPTHVLIVGDDGVAPVKYVFLDGWNFVNEDFFVELEGNDYFPEMLIGRFTNEGALRLSYMVQKFMNYEKTPYVQSPDWFKKALVCADSEFPSQRLTKRFTAQQMLQYGNFQTVDSIYNGYPCPGNVSTIINAINSGRSFLNYRGQGWTYGWWPDCIPFHTEDVSLLNNGAKLTFVTSIGCGVSGFDAAGGNCFGEEWVEMGSYTESKGACAFLGPTSNTHTAYNNAIDRGIYIGIFQGGIESPAAALYNGKLVMYSMFGGEDDYVEYHFKIYCELGDPSIHVWKDIPQSINVTYTDTITTGFSQPEISVTYAGSGLPVANAQVCISGGDVYAVGYTDVNGYLMLNVTPSAIGVLNLLVRGGTVIPFEGSIQVVEGVENVALDGDPVLTDLDGNDDGLINPNENCTIVFTLKNYGTQIANNVIATLSVPDSVTDYVQVITTTPVNFGNIGPNQSVTGSPFQFFIKPECPVGYIIPFKLDVVSNTSSWNYYAGELVHGCQLAFSEYLVDDEGNALRNFRMDPGETVKVFLKIINQGDDVAPDISGILRSNDQYITVLDSVGTFTTLLPDSSVFNNENYFSVKVADNCPLQYEASYSVLLSTQNGLYPYSTISPFIIPVAMPSGFDPTGPDLYGYRAFSSDDVLFEQSPQFNWVEINSIGTQIVPTSGNSVETVSLPFNIKYYGINYSQVSISIDGWLALGSVTLEAPENFALPHTDAIPNMIGVFWDDLFSTNPGETGKLYYYNDAVNHRFVIEWDQVGHADDYTNKETFEVILLDPAYYPTETGDGEIICEYKTVEEPGSCTIGSEDNTETIGLDYVFNDFYDITATQLRSQFAIKFTTDSATVVSVEDENEIAKLPTNYVLEQNYPNPFNPETRINYSIPEAGYIKLSIYDINGLLVNTLQEGNLSAGRYTVVWNGKNNLGNKVGSGVYFYRLQANPSADGFVQVKKMILLK